MIMIIPAGTKISPSNDPGVITYYRAPPIILEPKASARCRYCASTVHGEQCQRCGAPR